MLSTSQPGGRRHLPPHSHFITAYLGKAWHRRYCREEEKLKKSLLLVGVFCGGSDTPPNLHEVECALSQLAFTYGTLSRVKGSKGVSFPSLPLADSALR